MPDSETAQPPWGLGSSCPLPHQIQQSRLSVHVGSQLGGKGWGPEELGETMADGLVGGREGAQDLLPPWTLTPFLLGGKQQREVSQPGEDELGQEAEPRPPAPNCSDPALRIRPPPTSQMVK